MPPQLKSCWDKWDFRCFVQFLANDAERGPSKRKQDSNCPFAGERHPQLLQGRSGLCCVTGEILAPSTVLRTRKLPQ